MGFEYINVGKLDKYIGVPGVVIIDLREPSQYAWYHFAGAVNVPFHQMENILDKDGFDKNGNIIINGNTYNRSTHFIFYCERGSLSMVIGSRMASLGYSAGTVVGGIRQYRGRNMVR